GLGKISPALRQEAHAHQGGGVLRSQAQCGLVARSRMIGISDFSIRTAEIGIGIHLQSRIASKLQNHPAMLDGLREIFMLLLVRADLEMYERVSWIDFNGGEKMRNGLFVFPFIHQSPTQTVLCHEISARNLERMGPQRNAVVPVGELPI